MKTDNTMFSTVKDPRMINKCTHKLSDKLS